MDADAAIEEIIRRSGWNDLTMLGLALRYIESAGKSDDFVDFLRKQEKEENEESKPVPDPP